MCGKWEVVTIDDSFPCYSDNRAQIYSKAVRNQLWVCLVEKAAAKMYGCYEALNSGTLLEGLSTLTGAPCEVSTQTIIHTYQPREFSKIQRITL